MLFHFTVTNVQLQREQGVNGWNLLRRSVQNGSRHLHWDCAQHISSLKILCDASVTCKVWDNQSSHGLFVMKLESYLCLQFIPHWIQLWLIVPMPAVACQQHKGEGKAARLAVVSTLHWSNICMLLSSLFYCETCCRVIWIQNLFNTHFWLAWDALDTAGVKRRLAGW